MIVAARSEERFSRNAEPDLYTSALQDALAIFHQWSLPDVREPDEVVLVGNAIHQLGLTGRANDRRGEIGRAVQQECRARSLHFCPTGRSRDLSSVVLAGRPGAG